MRQAKIAFFGGGNMTQSLVSGLIAEGYNPAHIWVLDQHQGKLDLFAERYQVNTLNTEAQRLPEVDIVLFAIKPQSFSALPIAFRRAIVDQKPLVISVAAGIRLATLAGYFGEQTPVVRAMPNTPALIQSGATGLYANANTSESQKSLAEHILRCVGQVIWVTDEAHMDIVTAISGSGPAYYFLLMDMFKSFAVSLGLDEQEARLLCIQTALGTAKMALESDDDFTTLRQKVTSKGGTTEAAINCLLQEGLQVIIEKGLAANMAQSDVLAKRGAADIKLIDKPPEEE